MFYTNSLRLLDFYMAAYWLFHLLRHFSSLDYLLFYADTPIFAIFFYILHSFSPQLILVFKRHAPIFATPFLNSSFIFSPTHLRPSFLNAKNQSGFNSINSINSIHLTEG